MYKIVTGQSTADGLAKLMREQRQSIEDAAIVLEGGVKITLPIPPAACWPNSRPHWAEKSKAAKTMREAGYAAGVGSQPFTHPVIDAVFYHKRKRRHDRDNGIAACKNLIDGLTDAGCWVDDDVVRWGDVAFYVDADNPRVVLIIKERKP